MQKFGSFWTEEKLQKIKKYLEAYITALKKKRFKKIYIDAFAGTGYREDKNSECNDYAFLELDDIKTEEFIQPKSGSAKIALEIEPAFDEFIFIEKESSKCQELQKLKDNYPHLQNRIKIILREVPSNIRFISFEPLLSRIDSSHTLKDIDWVIVGGESGPNARPIEEDWVREIQRIAFRDGADFFFKQ